MVFKLIKYSNYLSVYDQEVIWDELDRLNAKKRFRKSDNLDKVILSIARKEGIEIGDMAISLLSYKWIARHNLVKS